MVRSLFVTDWVRSNLFIMKQKYILWFFFILSNLFIIHGENFISNQKINFAHSYLQNYTRLTLKDIVFADTSSLSENQELLVRGINEMVS